MGGALCPGEALCPMLLYVIPTLPIYRSVVSCAMLTRSMSRMPSSPIFRCSLQLVILSSFDSCHASRPGVSILVGLGIFCIISFLLLHTVVVVVMNYVFVDVLDILVHRLEFSHYFPACYQCLLSLIYIMIYIMPTGDYI